MADRFTAGGEPQPSDCVTCATSEMIHGPESVTVVQHTALKRIRRPQPLHSGAVTNYPLDFMPVMYDKGIRFVLATGLLRRWR
jgi:hypothetical protein